jgi:hypothetical protein
MNDFDPEDLPLFQIPQSILDKIYEFTGNSSEGSKGFLMVYPDQNGTPVVYGRCGSQIVEMGIRKSLEQYLIELENVDTSFDINGEQE